ncbi:MAG: hypothetical protein U5M50_02195 [Sphingobium sp.]|nr:hypothetical protein [Sphingobium sp.]
MTTIGEKVAHVRAAGQDRKHHCHWPGCEAQVPPAKWGCLKHWRMLPKHLRDEVWRTYRPGQERDMRPSAAYLSVAKRIQEWIGKQVAGSGQGKLL